MSILKNALEVDSLYVRHDEAEQEGFKLKREFETAKRRTEATCEDITDRIESLFDGMAHCIPSTIEEALGLAILLRSMTDGSVFLQGHEGPARERAEDIINNLVVGLSRLSSRDLPLWFEGHILAAENGTPPVDRTKSSDSTPEREAGSGPLQ